MIGWAALAVATVLAGAAGHARAEPLQLDALAVPLDVDDASVDRAGALRFLGGLALRSKDKRFGGLSGLAISPDGRLARIVSDSGYWVEIELRYDPEGRLADIGAAEVGRLLRPDGEEVADKQSGDAESLTRVGEGLAVSFERSFAVWLYRGMQNPFLHAPHAIPVPRALRGAPANGGVEALATLDDGRLVLIAEDFPPSAPFGHGWVGSPGAWQPFRWERTGLFRPTGATALPGGDLLVLERRFTWLGGLASRLSRVPAAALTGDAPVRGVELGRLEPPLLVENFEAVDARRDEAGRTLVYLASDDNFSLLQRTILLQFVLEPS